VIIHEIEIVILQQIIEMNDEAVLEPLAQILVRLETEVITHNQNLRTMDITKMKMIMVNNMKTIMVNNMKMIMVNNMKTIMVNNMKVNMIE
jgi:hypothetical protein